MAIIENVKEAKTLETNGVDADGFVEIQLNIPSLKFELDTKREGTDEIYTGQVYQGLLAGYRKFGDSVDSETGELREQAAFVLSLTKPGKAYDREGKPIARKIHDEVLLWPNAQINQAIATVAANGMTAEQAAMHPTHMLHLKIKPIKRSPYKTRDGKIQKMWTIKVSNGTSVARKDSKVAFGALSPVIDVPALQAQN
jgi:hypothetical protein